MVTFNPTPKQENFVIPNNHRRLENTIALLRKDFETLKNQGEKFEQHIRELERMPISVPNSPTSPTYENRETADKIELLKDKLRIVYGQMSMLSDELSGYEERLLEIEKNQE